VYLYTTMRYINRRFTYLLTYLSLTSELPQKATCYTSLVANMLKNKVDFIMPAVLTAHLQED